MYNNITLTLAPQHLLPLRHICRANYESIMANPEASIETKEIAADLYHRVMLLHNAVNAEKIAVNTRAKYDRYVSNGKPVTTHANRPRKPAHTDTNDINTTEGRTPEQAQEPPQDMPDIPDIPDIPAQDPSANTATLQQRPF